MDHRDIQQILQEYGLTAVYRSHTLHGDYPLLDLHGLLSLDALIETPHFARAAAEIGTVMHLWGGEHVRLSTPEPGAFQIEADHPELENLVRQHVTHAAQDLQRYFNLRDILDAPDHQLEVLKFLQEEPRLADLLNLLPLGLADLPAGGLQGLSREERLDRARALRGQEVMDPHDVRAFDERQAMQEQALLHFPPSEDAGLDPEPPLSDEDVMDLAARERLMGIEGVEGFYEGNDQP
ncbi:hypothetical protein [Deinococcus aluminii]|uniref:Uncharacterized protein n=1 Tax=Deinococcus aluminii TaxID=1656885 RepID=A0ABP9XEX1_9DEIO